MALSPTSSRSSGSAAGGGTTLADVSVAGADSLSIDTGAAGFVTTYALLIVTLYTRTDETVGGNTASDIAMLFNNISSAVYDWTEMDINNVTASPLTSVAQSNIHLHTASNSSAASVFGSHTLIVPNYGNTTGFKSANIVGGFPSSTAAQGRYESFIAGYLQTTAISRISMTLTGGGKFKIGSRLTVVAF